MPKNMDGYTYFLVYLRTYEPIFSFIYPLIYLLSLYQFYTSVLLLILIYPYSLPYPLSIQPINVSFYLFLSAQITHLKIYPFHIYLYNIIFIYLCCLLSSSSIHPINLSFLSLSVYIIYSILRQFNLSS